MDGISAYLEATHDITLHYEVINDEGKFLILEGTVIFMPNTKCRMLSPQDHFMDLEILGNSEGSFTVTW